MNRRNFRSLRSWALSGVAEDHGARRNPGRELGEPLRVEVEMVRAAGNRGGLAEPGQVG